MTEVEKNQFNKMFDTLSRIANHYQDPEELREGGAEEVGLDYEEALEMAYDNIQGEAKNALMGIKRLK